MNIPAYQCRRLFYKEIIFLNRETYFQKCFLLLLWNKLRNVRKDCKKALNHFIIPN